jgi:hypothetical protein
MTAKEAIDHLREWWNFCDCNAKICVSKDDEALAVLSALAESTQFAAYEEIRGRLADALKERDALRDEVVRLQDRHAIDMMELEAASKAEDELSTLKVENERLAKETALLKQDVCSALGAYEHEGPRLAALRVRGERDEAEERLDKAEAEVERLKKSYQLTDYPSLTEDYFAMRERAEKAEAELSAMRSEADAARPLIQQVEDTIDAYGKDPVLGEAVASLDDALDAYREAVPAGGKEPK